VRELSPLMEHDMIATVLAGELRSERFGAKLRAALARLGVAEAEAARPDTADAAANRRRPAVLRAYRRFCLPDSQFDGFPYRDVAWARVALAPAELLAVRYIGGDAPGARRRPAHPGGGGRRGHPPGLPAPRGGAGRRGGLRPPDPGHGRPPGPLLWCGRGTPG
jgi:hypothetical protein